MLLRIEIYQINYYLEIKPKLYKIEHLNCLKKIKKIKKKRIKLEAVEIIKINLELMISSS
jgi:hypothetical protein